MYNTSRRFSYYFCFDMKKNCKYWENYRVRKGMRG